MNSHGTSAQFTVRTPPPSPDPADLALGRQLAELLDRHGELPAQRIQALLPDLLGPEPALLNPLRDLVARPAFQQLLRRRRGSGDRQLRQALLEELADTYSARMMARLGAVLDGAIPMPMPTPPPHAPLPPPPGAPRRRARPAPQAQRRGGSERQRKPGLLPLLLLTGAITLVSGTVFAVLRSDGLCPTLGICLSGEGRNGRGDIDASLAEGEAAAEALEGAASLDELNEALERLTSAQLSLVSTRLSDRQQERLRLLQAAAGRAREQLGRERRAEDRLRQASGLIERLERGAVADERRFDRIQEARASLAAIPGDSFAATAALGLQRRLDAIRDRPVETPPSASPPGGEEAPAAGAEGAAPPPPALPAPMSPPVTTPGTPPVVAPPPPIPPADSAPPPPAAVQGPSG